MFSSKGSGPLFSLGGPSGKASNDAAAAKPLTAAEKYEQALVTANVFLEESRMRVTKSMNKYSAVANNNYWLYGYCGGNMLATMGACLALGNRWAIFRSYSGWIALAGGYFGGKACLATHSSVLLAGVVRQIDEEVEEAKRMDERTEHTVPDYLREVERLKQVKYDLAPTLPEAVEARTHHAEQTLDDRADALINAYLKRKEALQKK
ncbi:hypothetical protein NESM_000765900 [Novymonas esmeraldas]|uniref:Uncharacterized protein n=1 Tax=Novymonas esmeraldas TaxID=1808958 RepID=A0AAW0EXB2_9TRYP